jgi:predicted acyl esterase
MVSADILRGRYRTSFTTARPIVPNHVAEYVVRMNQQLYTFKRGHRIMVRVQSTWFPLYDRNPQTFVANIFHARPSDFRARTHRIWRDRARPSHVGVAVVSESSLGPSPQ